MTNKEQLKNMFEQAIEENAKYFYTEMRLPDHPETEIIINPIENMQKKLEYLDNAYDDDLKGVRAPVSIISYGWFYDMSQLEYTRLNFSAQLH